MVEGILQKMRSTYQQPIQYILSLGEQHITLNSLLGQTIHFEFLGEIYCQACQRKTKKSFGQGYCYPCFNTLASCDLCILRPSKCHYTQGTCREPSWGDTHCMIPHKVYVANSSGVKVGLTRHNQIPTRFIDQGATQALIIFEMKNRYHAGLMEEKIKEILADTTDWRKMLKGESATVDLKAVGQKAQEHAKDLAQTLGAKIEQGEIYQLQYPVEQHPQKVLSFSLEKNPVVEGRLLGIKGQYLILDKGVINIRKYTGYKIRWS